MTDEEKAKEWVRTNSGYSTKEFHGQKAIEAFLAGLEAGKDMAELEKEKCELLGIIQGKDKVIQELERRIASQRGTIRVYNNKLKARLEQVERLKQENKKLFKAKELIKEMLSILPKENIEGIYEITEEAELFLREGE